MLARLDLKPPIVVKPNWSSSMIYTEAQILDWVLSSIEGEVTVVESYAMWRNELFLDPDRPRDNEFLKLLGVQKKKDLRENDKWFLEFSGIQEVLDRHNVEYMNLSEEFWAKRVCDSESIHEAVNKKYSPVLTETLAASVPTRLYDLRGGTLIDLTKPKRSLPANFVSLSLKNMFGMIPTPYRRKYHGDNEELLTQSILDINKICNALFDVVGVIEGLFTTSETIDNPMIPAIHRNTGYIWTSDKPLSLDALVTTQLGIDPHAVEYLQEAIDVFGPWSNQIEDLGKKHRVNLPRV
jgi:uncharacterized protein (DUF362 family)